MKSLLKNSRQERERWVDVAKGLGILAVMYVHVGGRIGRNIIAPYYIQMFFFLSGYVFKKRSVENAIRNARIIRRYFINYSIIDYLIFIPASIMQKKDFSFYFKNAFGILYGAGMLYWPAEVDNQIHLLQVGNGPMWYLACLTIVWLLIALELRIVKRNFIFILWNIALVIASIFLKHIPIMMPWGGEKAIGMSIFLNLGMVVRQIEQSKKTCKFTIPLCSALSTLYLVLIANVNVEINISTRYYGVYDSFLVVLLIGILGIPLVILVSKLTTIVLKKSILEFWGQNTVVLLAFHGLIYKYIDMLSIETGEYYLWVVLKMLVALIICTLICYVANMVKDKKIY